MASPDHNVAKEAIMKAKFYTACVMLALGAALWTAPSVAQDYPNKPVRILVTFPPGGSSDVTAQDRDGRGGLHLLIRPKGRG